MNGMSEGLRTEAQDGRSEQASIGIGREAVVNPDVGATETTQRADRILEGADIQRDLINESSPYSSEVNEQIRSTAELSVYTDAGLRESTVNETLALKGEINPNQTDAMGLSNKQRMENGLAALGPDGRSINLHHIGQRAGSPLAELPDSTHKRFDGVLHDKTIATEVHGPDSNWDQQRMAYWIKRAQDF